MSEDVKSRRRYYADGRRAQAAASRSAVLDAARQMFLANGYAATSIPAVARAAGVSPELIYKSVGPKPALLKAVFDVSVTGDNDAVALEEREVIKRLQADDDGPRIIRKYAAFAANAQSRVAPISLLAKHAAAAEPDAAQVWQQMNAERLLGMSHFAEQLRAKRLLRKGLSVHKARDILWTYNSVEVYELLVLNRGWTLRAYADFLAQAMSAALLAD
jgi:AcrR family transcriptional regulator